MSCVGSWGQRAGHKGEASKTRLQGRGFGQAGEKSGASTAAFSLSPFPRQRNIKKHKPPVLAGDMPRRDTLVSAGSSRAFCLRGLVGKVLASKGSSWGNFVYRAKRKETARPDGARDAHGLGKCDVCKPPLTGVLICSSTGKPGWRGLHKAVRLELGVFPENLCHEGGHVSLFGVVQGKERVFLPTRPKTTSADAQGESLGDVTQMGGAARSRHQLPPQAPIDTIL